MSFQYELTLFCDGCDFYFDSSAAMRRRELPSEKSIIEAQTDWKFVKDKPKGTTVTLAIELTVLNVKRK